MILNDKVFIHTFKCAGSSIKYSLQKNPDVLFWRSHIPLYFFPSHLKSYTTIRNPLTWYKSFYFYELKILDSRIKKNIIFLPLHYLLYKNPMKLHKSEVVGFDEFLERALNFKDFISPFTDRIYFQISKQRWPFWQSFLYYERKPWKETFYQEVLERLGSLKCDNIYRMEDQLDKFCADFGIENLQKKNTTDYSYTLTNSQKNAIINKDEKILEYYKDVS